MRTFSELLRAYTEQTGVSDAELARVVGVQRQTIFRWKEGMVARPRSAEDVLRLASKLRLTPAERDELLLAAGFPPVEATAPLAADAETQPQAENRPLATPALALEAGAGSVAHQGPAPRQPRRHRSVPWAAAAIAVLLVAAIVFASAKWQARYPRAAAGETLVIVAQFGNYTGGAQGYNVAGRLSEALDRELDATGLPDTRVASWPLTITDEASAARALARSEAALLIWGEYDSGRVVARFVARNGLAPASRELSLTAATPADLPAVINSALPGDIRYLALYSLGQIYLDGKQPVAARAALGQARLNLPADPGTRAAHNFLWAYANQIAQPPDLDAAIEGYTEALELDAGLEAAHNNRAVAYLHRRAPGDLEGAVDDLTRYIGEHGDDSAAYMNKGSAYFLLGGHDNDLRALADFGKAIELAPDDAVGYYNRGLVYVRLDEGAQWRADLKRALQGGNSGAREGLCWGYSLSEEPGTAIDYCEGAITAGLGPGPLENLGVAYARTGKYDEAADVLRQYREELGKTSTGSQAKKTQIDEWLATLKAGKSPFDEATLRRLRED